MNFYEAKTEITLVCGDALASLKNIPDNFIQTCITSPPYFGLRNYEIDGQIGLEETPELYISRLVEVFREIKRVLRDDGTLWLNLGDSYARKNLIGIPWRVAFALQHDGWYLRSDIIWQKPNAIPESVKDRPTRSHEYVFLFSKSKKYYYNYEAIKEDAVNGDPNSPHGSIGTRSKNSGRRKQDEVGKRTYTGFNERYFSKPPLLKRNKRDVWTISVKPFLGSHFATFPPDLVVPCVLAGSSEGSVVADPFCGSGTVGMVSVQNNRRFIGIDLNPDYINISEKRIAFAMEEKENSSLIINACE